MLATDEAGARTAAAEPPTPTDRAMRPAGAPSRLYQTIARRIDAMIQEGGYAVGDRLPPERELAQRLGVSRPSAREAVIALEVAGIVEVRTGSGIYVRLSGASDSGRLRDFLAGDLGPGPYEALEMRRLLEGEAAFRAAGRLDAGAIAELRESVEGMRVDPAPVPQRGDASDRAFHELIAANSGNSLLAMMVRELWDARALPLWRRWMERTRTAAMHRERVAEHERILARLAAGDGPGAREAMHHHIDQVARRFTRG